MGLRDGDTHVPTPPVALAGLGILVGSSLDSIRKRTSELTPADATEAQAEHLRRQLAELEELEKDMVVASGDAELVRLRAKLRAMNLGDYEVREDLLSSPLQAIRKQISELTAMDDGTNEALREHLRQLEDHEKDLVAAGAIATSKSTRNDSDGASRSRKSTRNDSDGASSRERKLLAEKPVAEMWAMWLPLLALAVAWLVSYAVYGSAVSSDILGTL